jgi:hypothetical protein
LPEKLMDRATKPSMAWVFLEPLVPVQLDIDHRGFHWGGYSAYLTVLHAEISQVLGYGRNQVARFDDGQ